MSVFKVCLRILQKNLPSLAINFAIFIAVSVAMTILMRPVATGEFGRTRVNVAFFAGEETPLVEGLRQALAAQVNFVPLEDDAEKLQEALFYRRVHYILRVPPGFTAAFMRGEQARLQRTTVPDSASAIYIDLRLDRYLEILRLYVTALPELGQNEQVAFALADLEKEPSVVVAAPQANANASGRLQFYFNWLAYTLLFVIIVGLSAIFLAFNDADIKRRNLCSPLSVRTIGLQCFKACGVFALASWFVVVASSLVFGFSEITGTATWFYMLNALVFTVCVAGLALLVGTLAKNGEMVNAIANVVALGSSFLSGVFVPQELLGANVLRLASFTPTYWYVRANAAVAALADFSLPNLAGYFSALAIQAGFAVAFVAVALVTAKSKS
jgi:ABC-2 type transport system permease protein